MSQKEEIEKGFDRGVDFNDIKQKLINDFHSTQEQLTRADDAYTEKILCNRLIYCVIAMIQLINGSRISEACKAIIKFFELDEIDDKTRVFVKISKSEKLQYNFQTKEKSISKARFRKMRFPNWVDIGDVEILKSYKKIVALCLCIKDLLLRQRVRDYLLKNFECNTHSLRYAFINYMLHDQHKPMNEVAKFVGHKNTNQICTYTQNKNVEKLFDMDI